MTIIYICYNEDYNDYSYNNIYHDNDDGNVCYNDLNHDDYPDNSSNDTD